MSFILAFLGFSEFGKDSLIVQLPELKNGEIHDTSAACGETSFQKESCV